jgi:hypothetical protein
MTDNSDCVIYDCSITRVMSALCLDAQVIGEVTSVDQVLTITLSYKLVAYDRLGSKRYAQNTENRNLPRR